MNVQPQDEVPPEDVWQDPNLVEAFVNDMYLGMGHGLYEIMLASMADDSHFIHGYGTNEVVQSIHSPGNPGAWNDWRFEHYQWSSLYSRIRQVNTLLENIDEEVFTDPDFYDRILGEAHFLRAFYSRSNLFNFLNENDVI